MNRKSLIEGMMSKTEKDTASEAAHAAPETSPPVADGTVDTTGDTKADGNAARPGGNKAALWGTAIGIGSAAVVAALLYTRKRP